MSSFRDRMNKNMIGDWKKFNFAPVTLPDVNAEMRDLGRFYQTPNGDWFPSITTVLSILSKDAITAWRKRVGEEEAERISKYASERGTRVHEICEHYIDGAIDKLTNLQYTDLLTFKQIKPILDQNLDEVWVQEAPLYSDELQCAGRTDVIGKYRSKNSIVDFKTSKKAKKVEWIQNYFQQGAGYAHMFQERTGILCEQIVIIIACDSGETQVFIENYHDHIGAFKATRQKFRELNGV